MTIHRVSRRLSEGKALKDRPRKDRTRVMKSEIIRKAFERNPKFKMTHLAKKKGILMFTVRRAVKIEGGEELEFNKNALIDGCDKTEAT